MSIEIIYYDTDTDTNPDTNPDTGTDADTINSNTVVISTVDEIIDTVKSISSEFDSGHTGQDIGEIIHSVAINCTIIKLKKKLAKQNTFDKDEIFDLFCNEFNLLSDKVASFTYNLELDSESSESSSEFEPEPASVTGPGPGPELESKEDT